MKKRTRILVVLLAVWFAGVTAFIAYSVHDMHAKEVARCIDGALGAIAADREQGFTAESDKIRSRMDEVCGRQGNSSFHRQDWIGLAAFYLVPPVVIGLLALVISKAIRWGRKDRNAPVWKQTTGVLTAILIGFIYWTRHTGPSDTDDFFSCNDQSLNAATAEQARRAVTYDLAGLNAVLAVSNDKCMATKGYEYNGSSGCFDLRTSYCYGRKSTKF